MHIIIPTYFMNSDNFTPKYSCKGQTYVCRVQKCVRSDFPTGGHHCWSLIPMTWAFEVYDINRHQWSPVTSIDDASVTEGRPRNAHNDKYCP